MKSSQESIHIKAQSNKHGLFLIAIGLSLLVFILILAQWFWDSWRIVLIFAILTSLIIAVTGVLKKCQPAFSLTLTRKQLIYHHSHGIYQIKWQNIANISSVTESVYLDQITLPYIGIKLDNIDDFIPDVEQRLANKLIHEQKPLIIFALTHKLLTLEQSLINFDPYKLQHGKSISGPKAAFMHQVKQLHKAFGYHLFIPLSALDRDIPQSIALLNQCKQFSTN